MQPDACLAGLIENRPDGGCLNSINMRCYQSYLCLSECEQQHAESNPPQNVFLSTLFQDGLQSFKVGALAG
jgi:hypothetical protein